MGIILNSFGYGPFSPSDVYCEHHGVWDCYGNGHCIWCNSTAYVGCLSLRHYCKDNSLCEAPGITWPSYDSDSEFVPLSIDSCKIWSNLLIFSFIICSVCCCMVPWIKCMTYLIQKKQLIIHVYEVPLEINYRTKNAIIITTFIILLSVLVLCLIMIGQGDHTLLFTWIWDGLGILTFLMILPAAAVIYFAIMTYRILKKLIYYGQKTVHEYLLVSMYLLWWLILIAFAGMIIYSIATHNTLIGAVSYGSLFAIFLDLWHPVHHIQNEPSNAIISKFFGSTICDEWFNKCIQICFPRQFEQYTVLNENLNISMENDEKSVVEENEEKQEEVAQPVHDNCNLKYWEFIIYVAWINSFVVSSLICNEYESCLLSLAAFLPTIVNLFLFLMEEQRELQHRTKSLGCFYGAIIFTTLIFIGLVTCIILSCTCMLNDDDDAESDDSCEWPHIGVIVTVSIFVFAHLHQKRYCMKAHDVD